MTKAPHFGDVVHIRTIRRQLWCGREFGRAAVMVGAGMSRNADKARASALPVPLWRDLARTMYAEIQGVALESLKPDVKPDPVAVAGEYEDVFKRAGLDQLILRSIVDSDYTPGRLHRLLLALPWSDVFTTNYDTLLERARPGVYDRKYDLVNTAGDLVGRMQPRIVKLHGSFPSHRPFIITPEDYRCYPRRSAPFVNTVQQSIMENAFCLLGFSGDDANFLAWTGWVRDNLGDATPPIYLCGVLDLTGVQRLSLDRRGIIPIDLAPLFPREKWPDGDARRSMALEWLLRSLANGEITDPRSWPSAPSGGGSGLPPSDTIPSPSLPWMALANDAEGDVAGAPIGGSIQAMVARWAAVRQAYPGWVVCPKSNLVTLTHFIREWFTKSLPQVLALGPAERLNALHEIHWLIERVRYPLPGDAAAAIRDTLEVVAKAPETLGPELSERCASLAFGLMRDAREEGDGQAHKRWGDFVAVLPGNVPVRNARLQYERCLWHLSAFEQAALKDTLANWTQSQDLPFYEVRRAAILTELGDFREANRIANEALEHIRERSRPYVVDYELMSQEASAMILVRTLAFQDSFRAAPASFKRWDLLERYDCNAEEEIRKLRIDLRAPVEPTHVTRKEFDPGSYTISHRFQSDEKSDFGYQVLRALEDGGLALRCGHIAQHAKDATEAAVAIVNNSPVWAFSTFVRAGGLEDIKRSFTRERVVRLPANDRGILVERCVRALRKIVGFEQTDSDVRSDRMDSLSWHVAQGCCELLSRLTVVMTVEQRRTTLDIACALYSSSLFHRYFQLHELLGLMFRRVLEASDDVELGKMLPRILLLPIPEVDGFVVTMPEQSWPEPFREGALLERARLEGAARDEAWTRQVRRIIRVVAEGTPQARDRGLLRLLVLRKMGVLSGEDERSLGDAIWAQIDPRWGLPASHTFVPSAWMTLPGGDAHDARGRFVRGALLAEIPASFEVVELPAAVAQHMGQQSSVQSKLRDVHYYVQMITNASAYPWSSAEAAAGRITWTWEQASQLLSKLELWIANEERAKELHVPQDPFRDRTPILDELASYAVYVLGVAGGESLRTRVLASVAALERLGASTVATGPGTLLGDDTRAPAVAQALQRGFAGDGEHLVGEAVEGVFYWVLLSRAGAVAAPPPALLTGVGQLIALRRRPGLRSAIVWTRRLLELRVPLEKAYIDLVAVGLEWLMSETDVRGEDVSAEEPLIRYDERAEYRGLAAGLASTLEAYCIRSGVEVPSAVGKWHEAALRDPLPEVVKAWTWGAGAGS